MSIKLERVYERGAHATGRRFLVDRLWPRGIRKQDLQLDGWLRDLAPSTELRKWFGHDPERWQEFQRRYRAELRQAEKQPQLRELASLARRGPVILLYGARDPDHNEAVVLRDLLSQRAGR
jgi:uncharacterized protein YeaO (DUF488 family)